MGFFDGLGRMIMGKPVFEDGSTPTAEQLVPTTPQKVSGLRDENGHKVFPDINVKNLKTRRSGDKMRVTAWVTNTSDHRIRIDSIYMLKNRTIGQELSPNQGREITLYDGDVADDDDDNDARIVYRIQENNDLFQSDYDIEFNRESDGKYTVEELHDEGEVRDI